VTCDEREEGDYLPNFASLGKRLCLPDWPLKKILACQRCMSCAIRQPENFIKMRCLPLSLSLNVF
jgi:hypothetical protein